MSKGDELFRAALVKHGFKRGTVATPGGWRCYITNVVKSVHRAWKWNQADPESAFAIAERWAGVLAWELDQWRPSRLAPTRVAGSGHAPAAAR